MTSVLVVEDNASTREALAEALRHAGFTPATAPSGNDALDLIRTRAPDLVVLDLGLPDMDGTDAVVAIRKLCDAPILVVSGSRRTRRQADVLDAGADDYLDKPFDVSELRARLRAAERRMARTAEGPSLRRFADLEVDPHGRRLSRGAEEIRLTDIEWRLLDGLLADAGRVVTHRRLTTAVWGARAGSEMHSALRVHVRSLRRKLGDDVRAPRYIRADTGVGYRWVALPVSSVETPRIAAEGAPPAVVGPLTASARALEDLIALRVEAGGASPGSALDRARSLVSRLVEACEACEACEEAERP